MVRRMRGPAHIEGSARQWGCSIPRKWYGSFPASRDERDSIFRKRDFARLDWLTRLATCPSTRSQNGERLLGRRAAVVGGVGYYWFAPSIRRGLISRISPVANRVCTCNHAELWRRRGKALNDGRGLTQAAARFQDRLKIRSADCALPSRSQCVSHFCTGRA